MNLQSCISIVQHLESSIIIVNGISLKPLLCTYWYWYWYVLVLVLVLVLVSDKVNPLNISLLIVPYCRCCFLAILVQDTALVWVDVCLHLHSVGCVRTTVITYTSKYNVVEYSTVQYNTLHSTVQYSTMSTMSNNHITEHPSHSLQKL